LNNSVNATSYAWDFGDGNTSTVANPSHTYGTGGNYTVTLIASNGNCSATFTFDIMNVSTEELSATINNVYPNPTQGIVNINVTETAQIQIMDLTGKVLMNDMRNAGNHQVNLDGFSNGLYIMSITSQNAQQLIKIQKN
jgi:PKD repeat protein